MAKIMACLKHKMISSGIHWIPATAKFFDMLGKNGVIGIIFQQCDKCFIEKEKGHERKERMVVKEAGKTSSA